MVYIPDALLILMASTYGLIIGSFINVVAYRLPKILFSHWLSQARDLLHIVEAEESSRKMTLSFPRSHCPRCKKNLRIRDNVPVVSYLMLGGRCAFCSTRISTRYPLVEAGCALMSAAVAWRFGPTPAMLAMLACTWILLACSLIDFDHKILPDAIVVPAIWGGLLINYFGLLSSLNDALLGAISGYLFFAVLAQIMKVALGRETMGQGDCKLLALIGAWGGWQLLPQVIIMSAICGIVVVLCSRRASVEDDRSIPFGPSLALAGWGALQWGHTINTAYLRFVGIGS